MKTPSRNFPMGLIQNIAVALTYLLTAKLGFLLALEQTNATAVWPPTGIALAACLVVGFHIWPGIFLGAFLANMLVLATGPFMSSLAVSLGTATGNTLEALISAYLVSRFIASNYPFNRTFDAIRFILLGALASPLISATIGASSFCIYNSDWSRFSSMWLTWWLGDAVGVLIFAPLLLTWEKRTALRWDKRRAAEAATLVVLFLLVEMIIFVLNFPLEYLIFPVLFWTALRFGQFETAVTVTLVMVTFLVCTIKGLGPFAGKSLNNSLLFLQSYLGVASASTLLLSALVNSRNSAEVALRASEEKFRTIFEHAPVGIFQSTSDGRFSSLNGTLAAMFGYPSPHEMINVVTDIANQIFAIPDQRHIILAKARDSEDYVREEIAYRRKDGSRFIANLYIRMLRDSNGEASHLEGFVEDISERKQAEDLLLGYQDSLERLVTVRTAELQETNERLTREVEERARAEHELLLAKERAETADQIKSAFLATMSHELRTPLNSIIGFTGILLQRLGGPINEEQEKQLTMVRNSANHLLSLISDVLDISKIEAGQLTVASEPFNLQESILKVVQSVRPLAEKKGLELSVEIVEDVRDIAGDVRRVEQILFNLLSNAVKFTEQGSISVRCMLEADSYRTTVTDTGIGIKTDDLERLFKPFHQIDTGLNRKYEGTGLGLSICKRLVELMGGSMQVESSPGKGSIFGFTLPLERNQA
jgi:PAS domain S-box-containing protein